MNAAGSDHLQNHFQPLSSPQKTAASNKSSEPYSNPFRCLAAVHPNGLLGCIDIRFDKRSQPGSCSSDRTSAPRPKNIKSPPDLSAGQGQMGDGSSPLSLSRTGIRRHPRGGCRLPDAILHGKRSFRPRSRAVQRLAVAGFRVRLFSSLRLVVAPPACEPGQDTPVIFIFASSPLSAGSAAAFDGAFARCHGSRLFTLRLLFAHSPAVSFLTSPALGSFSRGLPSRRVLPGACAPFVRLSAAFIWRSRLLIQTARVARTVLMRSSNRLPSG